MKILIVSDSHGHSEVLDDLVRKYKDVEIFLHAGDSEVPPHTLYPYRVVKGNCDYYFDCSKEYIIPTPFGNLLLRHKEDASLKYLKDHEIMFYVYGHSHVKTCKKKNGICYINPGAICYPRDTSSSYAILEVDEQGAYVTFYNLENDEQITQYHVFIGVPTPKEDVQVEEDEGPTLEELTNALKQVANEVKE